MKKLLSSTALALVVSAFATAPSFAGCCFGLFPKCCGCCGCGAKFCVRQYNAFSPVCSGTVFCDGCCPFGACGGGGGYGGYGACAGGMCGPGGCGVMPFSGMMNGGPAGTCGGGFLGSLPSADPGVEIQNAPAAAPATPMPAGTSSQLVNDRPIQNAAFRPASYVQPRTVAPAPMQPQLITAPSYWGN